MHSSHLAFDFISKLTKRKAYDYALTNIRHVLFNQSHKKDIRSTLTFVARPNNSYEFTQFASSNGDTFLEISALFYGSATMGEVKIRIVSSPRAGQQAG